MKKLLIYISILPLFFLGITFGCKFAEDDELLSAPSVELNTLEKAIVVSRENHSSSISCVYVYRLSNEKKAEEVHIATIYPKYVTQNQLIFTDDLVCNNVGYKYKYVYIDSDGTSYKTDWSSKCTVSNNLSKDTTTFCYDTSSSSLIYNITDVNIKLETALDSLSSSDDTDVNSLLSNYTPYSIFSTSSETKAFPVYTSEKSLRDFLPASFYDKEITVTGIVGCYPHETSDGNVDCIYWTEPAEIKVQQYTTDSSGNPVLQKADKRTFTISSNIEYSGIDY